MQEGERVFQEDLFLTDLLNELSGYLHIACDKTLPRSVSKLFHALRFKHSAAGQHASPHNARPVLQFGSDDGQIFVD